MYIFSLIPKLLQVYIYFRETLWIRNIHNPLNAVRKITVKIGYEKRHVPPNTQGNPENHDSKSIFKIHKEDDQTKLKLKSVKP